MSTRERFIELAADLFYAQGFHAVGLDNILSAVGVTKTTFYNHFTSKDDLIIAVLNHRDAIEAEELARDIHTRAGDDPREQLLALFDVLHDWFRSPTFNGCMFLNAAVAFPAPNDPIHRAASTHALTMHAHIHAIAHAAGAADPDALASQLLLLISGAIASTHVSGEPAGHTARAIAQSVIEHHLAPRVSNA